MKTLLLTLGFQACVASSLAEDQIRIIGALHEDAQHVFRVSRTEIQRSLAWDPEVQPLPFDLHKQILRARELCLRANDHLGEIDLWQIRFRKEYDPKRKDTAFTETNSYWYVMFSFQLKMPGVKTRFREVLMLLDGTLASETKESFPARGNRGGGQQAKVRSYPAPINPNATVLAKNPGFISSEKLSAGFDEPAFAIPTVRWHPFTEGFRFDLANEARRNMKRLHEGMNVKDEIILREISVKTFFPTGAVKARGESYEAHQDHWLIEFIYWTPALSEPLEYGSYLLLDGRTFEDTLRLWPFVDVDGPRLSKPK